MAITISPVNIESRKSLGIKAGDTVRVSQKIQERGKTRIQVFEGIVLARKHGNEPGAMFTVRKVSGGVGVEKIFPLYSPLIDKIEIIRRSKVRRAKLYYIREKVAREIRRQMRHMRMMEESTVSDIEEKEMAARAAEDVATKAEEVVPEGTQEEAAKEDTTEKAPSETAENAEAEKKE